MKIVIDDREDIERIQYLKEYEFFQDAAVTRLTVGDILFMQEDNHDIAIEVKTKQDFIGSCRSRRMQAEALKMKKEYPFSFIVLYDDGKFNGKYIQYTTNELYGNIVSLSVRYKVPVFMAKNKKHFIALLKAIVKNVDKSDSPIEPPIVRQKNNNEMINVLIGLPKVGEKMARTLLDIFGTPGGVFNATDEELDEVPRLAKVTKAAIKGMR